MLRFFEIFTEGVYEGVRAVASGSGTGTEFEKGRDIASLVSKSSKITNYLWLVHDVSAITIIITRMFFLNIDPSSQRTTKKR